MKHMGVQCEKLILLWNMYQNQDWTVQRECWIFNDMTEMLGSTLMDNSFLLLAGWVGMIGAMMSALTGKWPIQMVSFTVFYW